MPKTIDATNKAWLSLLKFWWWLRQVTGDAAYENYLRHASRGDGRVVVSAEQFYLERLRRKYSRISRCC